VDAYHSADEVENYIPADIPADIDTNTGMTPALDLGQGPPIEQFRETMGSIVIPGNQRTQRGRPKRTATRPPDVSMEFWPGIPRPVRADPG
jgi:hypothetical protein